MRLVDIDDIRAMKFLSEEDDPSESDGEREYRNGWNDALTAINDIQPSAEPVRMKGIWEGKPIAGYCKVRCSACGATFRDNSGRWNFCPNCGADMRGGQNE